MQKIGQHFTLKRIAQSLSAKALGFVKKDPGEIKILEPACGDGVFLLECFKHLRDATGKNSVAENIYGVDTDPGAISQAHEKLFELSGHGGNLRCADALFCDFDRKFDLIIGNPPFLGGMKISTLLGAEYLGKIKSNYVSYGLTDYCAYWLQLADRLLKPDGVICYICTNTISQGDTRRAGLRLMIERGYNIFHAVKGLTWPGQANVTVSIVFLSRSMGHKYNSRLNKKPERPDPKRLAANADLSFQGSKVLGMGFTITPKERGVLITSDPRNAECIFPYIGGKEVNTSPTHDFHRYVINLGQMSLEEAAEWPDLINIVQEKVKPERDKLRENSIGLKRKKYWWQYGSAATKLYQSIQDLPRCLVVAHVSKHIVFSFQPTDRIFGTTLYAFPLVSYASFSTLQSRIHEFWASLLTSSFRNTLRYTTSDVFETFPFPEPSRQGSNSPLEHVGRKLYENRARFMVDTEQGLTKTYNALKDPLCNDPRIIELRDLHREMDRAVLAAYGWDDLVVPPYGTPESDTDKAALQAFHDEVIDRLFVLNKEQSR